MTFLDDFLSEKSEYVETGKYYPFLPKLPTDTYYVVRYDNIEDKRKYFENVIQNVPVEGARAAIKTNTVLPYKTTGYFQAQDGTFYQIVDISVKQSKEANKESLRLFKTSGNKEYTLRLVEIDYKL